MGYGSDGSTGGTVGWTMESLRFWAVLELLLHCDVV